MCRLISPDHRWAITMGGGALEIVSRYVWPNVPSILEDISKLRAAYPRPGVRCGDFSARNTLWNGLHDFARGIALMNALLSEDLDVLNDGSPTCVRLDATLSVFYLEIASRDTSFVLSVEPNA